MLHLKIFSEMHLKSDSKISETLHLVIWVLGEEMWDILIS